MILETKISNSQLREIIRLFEAVFFFNLEWSFFCMKQIKYICKKLRRYPKFIIYRMVTFLTDGRSLGLVPDETNSHLNFHFLDAIQNMPNTNQSKSRLFSFQLKSFVQSCTKTLLQNVNALTKVLALLFSDCMIGYPLQLLSFYQKLEIIYT